jgi:hypothetical protein
MALTREPIHEMNTKAHEATRTNSNLGGRPVRLFAKPSLGLLDFQFCFDEIFGA